MCYVPYRAIKSELQRVLLGVCALLAAGIALIPAASEELHNEEFATVHPTQMTCLLKLASRSCDE